MIGYQPQPDRWRCLEVGCNPFLTEASAKDHKQVTRHQVAKWPERSPEAIIRDRKRSRGHHRKYNAGRNRGGSR